MTEIQMIMSARISEVRREGIYLFIFIFFTNKYNNITIKRSHAYVMHVMSSTVEPNVDSELGF